MLQVPLQGQQLPWPVVLLPLLVLLSGVLAHPVSAQACKAAAAPRCSSRAGRGRLPTCQCVPLQAVAQHRSSADAVAGHPWLCAGNAGGVCVQPAAGKLPGYGR